MVEDCPNTSSIDPGDAKSLDGFLEGHVWEIQDYSSTTDGLVFTRMECSKCRAKRLMFLANGPKQN